MVIKSAAGVRKTQNVTSCDDVTFGGRDKYTIKFDIPEKTKMAMVKKRVNLINAPAATHDLAEPT